MKTGEILQRNTFMPFINDSQSTLTDGMSMYDLEPPPLKAMPSGSSVASLGSLGFSPPRHHQAPQQTPRQAPPQSAPAWSAPAPAWQSPTMYGSPSPTSTAQAPPQSAPAWSAPAPAWSSPSPNMYSSSPTPSSTWSSPEPDMMTQNGNMLMYSANYPELPSLVSGTAEYRAPAVHAHSPVSLDDVDNAERQYKTRRALQMAGLATIEEILEAKKREYELLAENAGQTAEVNGNKALVNGNHHNAVIPEWVDDLQQQLTHSLEEQFKALHITQQQLQQQPSMNGRPMMYRDDSQKFSSAALEIFKETLAEHSQSVQSQLQTVTDQINEIGQSLIDSVRNMNRYKNVNGRDNNSDIYQQRDNQLRKQHRNSPLIESAWAADDRIGLAVIYPRDPRGGVSSFSDRFSQIKTLRKGVQYPNFPAGANQHQLDRFMQVYEIQERAEQLKDLKISAPPMMNNSLSSRRELELNNFPSRRAPMLTNGGRMAPSWETTQADNHNMLVVRQAQQHQQQQGHLGRRMIDQFSDADDEVGGAFFGPPQRQDLRPPPPSFGSMGRTNNMAAAPPPPRRGAGVFDDADD